MWVVEDVEKFHWMLVLGVYVRKVSLVRRVHGFLFRAKDIGTVVVDFVD